MPSILDDIVADKRNEVEQSKKERPQQELERQVRHSPRPRNFFKAVTRPNRVNVVAEFKRASPSAGRIRDDMGAVEIARSYAEAGAAAISCLTDRKYFEGSLEDLTRIKEAIDLPVLRKDFITDPYQVYEARAAGADAVLLIAECLTESQLLDLLILSRQLQMTALIEVHDVESLLRVRPHIGFPHSGYFLLGINNRDLRTMQTDLSHTLRLLDMVEDRRIVVSESGIHSPADVQRLTGAGVRTILIGEHLMRQSDPGAALRELVGQ